MGPLADTERVIERRIDGAAELMRLHQDLGSALTKDQHPVAADAVLVAVMLAGDACRYGTPPVTVHVTRAVHVLRIVVRHRPGEESRSAEDARGREDYRDRLLDRMTTARGVEDHDGMITTWAEIKLASYAHAS